MTVPFLVAMANTLRWMGEDLVLGQSCRYRLKVARGQPFFEQLDGATLVQLLDFFWMEVWCVLRLHEVSRSRGLVAQKVFDQAAQYDVSVATRWLQQALRGAGAIYLCVDGKPGPKTIAALNAEGDPAVVLPLLMGAEADYWRWRAKDDPAKVPDLKDRLRRANWDPRTTQVG